MENKSNSGVINWIWNIYSALKKSYLPRKYISYNVQRLHSTVIS